MNAFLTPSTAPCLFLLLKTDFTSVSGMVENSLASLNWTVSANENAAYFEVQKSADGKDFRTIGKMSRISKSGVATYSFTEGMKISSRSYYRVLISSGDGARKISRTITLNEGNGNEK